MIDLVLVPLIVVGLVLNGLRLRAHVPTVLSTAAARDGAEGPGADASGTGGADLGEVAGADAGAMVTADGIVMDEAVRHEVTAHARADGLELVDVVPGDLLATAARDLVRVFDPKAFRASRLLRGHSAGAAVWVSPGLVTRAGLPEAGAPEAADVMELVRRLRPYAEHADVVVVPALRAAADDLAKRRARLRANGVSVPVHTALEVIPYALTVAALAVAWPWGLIAVAAYSLQPYLVFAGTALRPRGLHTAALLRAVHDPYVWVRTAAGRWRSAAEIEHDAASDAAVPYYQAEVARGTGRFFEPRRETCPWCGSAELAVRLRSTDLVMGKPGAFTLERCGGCGHVFQNPRLTPEGLDFYYRDAYDGLGAGIAELIFATGADVYRDRARMLARATSPKSWLDVGTGHAHFCAVAREVLPDTVFDGLDQGAGIEEAERRGWVATAHRGMFPGLADELTGQYDVISMHHYLEHTRDPFTELDTAARVLPPGGFLLIELPDPQWRLAPLFGRYWMPWFQPQHQHMMPIGNLTKALADRGLVTVSTERGPAHQANDLVIAAYLFFARLAPERSTPWSARPPTPLWRTWQAVVWTVGIPTLAAGLLIDQTLVRALARRWDLGNAYRVLARKEEPGGAA
ncbi:MAG TPA: class I SAM-dependent methyltransferase [Streptosporangiaceae bacterium]|nr:class I SAM-dependent methyltransferase [Streptosporangiaceae bacterium]